MEEFIEDGEEADHLHVQIQEMLETNTKLSLPIDENEETPEMVIDGLDEAEVASSAVSDVEETESEEKSGQNGSGNLSFEVNDEEGILLFGLGGKEGNYVYAEIDGTRFDCTVEGDTAACNINGAPQKGKVNLYDKKTNQLLFSYAYEYAYEHAWEGQKKDQGNDGEHLEDGGGGMGKNKDSKDK